MWKAMAPKLVIWVQICLLVAAKANPPNMAKPGCKDRCGKVSIPFPFGIGAGCFLDPWFEIECRASPTNHSNFSSSNNKPFLPKLFDVEFIEVNNLDTFGPPQARDQTVTVMLPPVKVCSGDTQRQQQSFLNLTGSPYSYSAYQNVFIMKGCPGSAVLVDQSSSIVAGCATVCDTNNSAIPTNSCYGVHCCQTALSSIDPIPFYQIDFSSQASGELQQTCLVATLIASDSVNKNVPSLSSSNISSAVPVKLTWRWTDSLDPENNDHATCSRDSFDFVSCSCDFLYNGNPYLGCQAPEGCEGCRGYCTFRLDGPGYYCKKKPPLNLAALLVLGSSFVMLLLLASVYGLFRLIKNSMEIKRKAKFFKRNGGLLLQQQLSSNEGVVERTKIFTISELNKATNNFNENRILGQGGQGTVYKGMLIDGSIVAVKKSRLVDESQLEQFINEVVILSRVNHRHVVKLFGCCLDIEVPLLVYEYMPSGTLYQHIHDPDEEFVISWEMRLKIVADSAGAIAYLHSSSSIPIYHRDIKSSNILLDERHRAKVSDFGSSKTIVIDQTHLTTLVQGTVGYLDPEYFRSYQFTEKSDVYSFGVVLLELLTTKKSIFRDANTIEQKNLVTEFQDLAHNSRLSEILDPEIVKQAKEDELISVVELAKRCVSWRGKMRPTMKEVAMTLERIMKSPAQVSAWYQQQEAIPIQYAAYDDFDTTDISGSEFTSITLPVGSSSPPYTDEYPLL